MKIVCIGWGSLIWNPGELKTRGKWDNDGPYLPIEFARTSKDGRLTLVITTGADLVKTLWIQMDCINLEEAKKALREREGTGDKYIASIGAMENPSDDIQSSIKSWMLSKDIDYAIWTNLPPKFKEINEKIPTEKEAVEYIENLKGTSFEEAKKYILNAPQQVQTKYRKALQATFGIN